MMTYSRNRRVHRDRASAPVLAAASLVVGFAFAAPGTARGQAEGGEPASVLTAAETPARPRLGIGVSLGFRSDLIRSTGLDPFSTTDVVPQSALSASYGWSVTPRFGLALAAEWNHGEVGATARGAETTLTIDRLSVGIEGRWSVRPRLTLFGRVAPGMLRDRAEMVDASAPPPAYGPATVPVLQRTSWGLAGDVGGGLAFRLVDVQGTAGPVFTLWVVAEGGYGTAAAHDLVLARGVETQPGRTDEAVHLGRLRFGGPFTRFRLALSF